MENLTITTVSQLKDNAKRITKLIEGRKNYIYCADSFIKHVENEILVRQDAEDKYLAGFEYALGL